MFWRKNLLLETGSEVYLVRAFEEIIPSFILGAFLILLTLIFLVPLLEVTLPANGRFYFQHLINLQSS
jgi:hypothetical protein